MKADSTKASEAKWGMDYRTVKIRCSLEVGHRLDRGV